MSAFNITPSMIVFAGGRSCFTPRTQAECLSGFITKIKILKSDCWEWTGARQRFGHGMLKFMGKMVLAHRLSKGLSIGRPLAKSEFACHNCDNPWCVNPAHIYIGTHQTNARDRQSRNRTDRTPGEFRGTARLTRAEVLEIRAKFIPRKYSLRKLAVEYGVCFTQIKNIIYRRQWTHI